MRHTKIGLLLFSVVALGACQKLIGDIVTRYVTVSGAVAAAMARQVTQLIQEQLLESATGMDVQYVGDGKFVLVPLQDQPDLGEAVTGPAKAILAPAFDPQAMRMAADASGTTYTKTGYVLSAEPGPDGTTG